MKLMFTLFLVAFGAPVFADDSRDAMLDFARDTDSNFYADHIPEGYEARQLFRRPRLSRSLKAWLKDMSEKRAATWKQIVTENPSEFGDDLSEREIQRIANNPKRELGVQYLIQLNDLYAIYKDGELIGYVYSEVADYVESAIIQDGAWFDVFLDADGGIVMVQEQSA